MAEEPTTPEAPETETLQPATGSVNKQKRMIVIIAALAVVAAVGAALVFLVGGNNTSPSDSSGTQDMETTSIALPELPEVETDPSVPDDYNAALRTAQSYINTLHLSDAGTRKALQNIPGQDFSTDAIDYAMAHVQANYNENALNNARTYQAVGYSPEQITAQLTSSDGDGFTAEEAQYAIAHLDQE